MSEKKAEKRAKNGRNPDGTFAIGNKGGGRPKKPAALKRHAQEAVEELYEIACDASNPVKVMPVKIMAKTSTRLMTFFTFFPI